MLVTSSQTPKPHAGGSGRTRLVQAALLGLLLGLHFLTRLHAQQVTPLGGRHFYPLSYLVSLSLIEGRGFGYLLPKDASLEDVWKRPLPAPGDPAYPVLAFLRLAGQEAISERQLADYLRSGARVVPADPVESTRILDIHVAAWLWRAFGVSWSVYFCFYALVSTAACFSLFVIVRRATGNGWIGLAASAGFLASPLEHYAGAWSTRDSVPLWFTALAFAALAAFTGCARTTRTTLLGGFGVGVASLVGLGWRPDFQLVPPILLVGLAAALVAQRRPWPLLAQAVAAFGAGCAAVLLLLRALGPGAYSQGGTVFHTAWYGETTRSNLLQTENAFQVARDDQLTLYQANYFARARSGGAPEAVALSDTKEPLHYRRCRAMYLELLRYQAMSWWRSLPWFLARSARLDQPTLLGSEQELAAFRESRRGWLKPSHEPWLDRYGSLLPWLMLIGLGVGLFAERSRILTALLLAYYACYGAIVLLVLPEAKHTIPLLLPVHVIGAIGLWGLSRAVGTWRGSRGSPREGDEHGHVHALRGRISKPVVIGAALGVGWIALGLAAHAVSRQQRTRIVDAVRHAMEIPTRPTAAGETQPETDAKRLSVHVAGGSRANPVGYLVRVRATRPSNLLLVHVRGTSAADGFLAYYTRHPVEPGADRLFFFGVVAGAGIGDPRPYTAHVRLVGPARIAWSRTVDLSHWPLGLPLSLVLDEDDQRSGPTLVGAAGAATEVLPTPSEVGRLLEDPGAFLSTYRSP